MGGRILRITKDQWGADEELAAVCLTDVFDDGLSMVYSFYDPDGASSSLGIYVILDHVALVKEAGLPFLLFRFTGCQASHPKLN